jgi:mono/diheme cytochrome c family protein
VSRVRASAALAAVMMLCGCESTREDPLMRMGVQPKYLAYQASPYWVDGRSSRTPPVGTVSRAGRDTLRLMDWKAEDGTFKDAFPAGLQVDEAFVRRGKRRFEVVCATCHGVKGDGKSIVGENMALHPAPSLVALTQRPLGYFFEVTTNGHGLMPSFAAEVPVEERWAVAAYVRALQLSRVPLAALTPDERRKLEVQPAQKEGTP